jgi:hypothetical protein
VVGVEQVVLASYLMAAPDNAVVSGMSPPQVAPFGLMDGLPGEALAEARGWQRHVVEVETGLPSGAEPGTAVRAQYDPAARTLVQRTEAKAEELGVGYRTVERMRARYAQRGLWGFVDQRLVRRVPLGPGKVSVRPLSKTVRLPDGSETTVSYRLGRLKVDTEMSVWMMSQVPAEFGVTFLPAVLLIDHTCAAAARTCAPTPAWPSRASTGCSGSTRGSRPSEPPCRSCATAPRSCTRLSATRR